MAAAATQIGFTASDANAIVVGLQSGVGDLVSRVGLDAGGLANVSSSINATFAPLTHAYSDYNTFILPCKIRNFLAILTFSFQLWPNFSRPR